jgi:heme oxygenase
MSLKELTAEKHIEAERSAFMKLVFTRNMSKEVWTYWTFNKMHWYNAIEVRARDAGLLDDVIGLERTYKLYQDFQELAQGKDKNYTTSAFTERYCDYIMSLQDNDAIMAHLYVWHMGDLHGGQMIKSMLPNVPHRNLEFNNLSEIIVKIRGKLHDGMAKEANIAFEWAIILMNQFVIEKTNE